MISVRHTLLRSAALAACMILALSVPAMAQHDHEYDQPAYSAPLGLAAGPDTADSSVTPLPQDVTEDMSVSAPIAPVEQEDVSADGAVAAAAAPAPEPAIAAGAEPQEKDPLQECRSQFRLPDDITKCITKKMDESDRELRSLYDRAAREASIRDGSEKKVHGQALVSSAMAFDVFRETECQRDKYANMPTSRIALQPHLDKFKACRTALNRMQIKRLSSEM